MNYIINHKDVMGNDLDDVDHDQQRVLMYSVEEPYQCLNDEILKILCNDLTPCVNLFCQGLKGPHDFKISLHS